MPNEDDGLLQFPCDFAIKAMGRAADDIEPVVVEIVRRHAPGTDVEAVRARASRNGNWIAVTVVIQAQSKAQLDAIYQELSDHDRVTCAF